MNAHRPWLLERAVARPTGTAVVFEDQPISWSELAREAEVLALRLASLGVGRGDRVAVRMATHPRFVALLHACQRLGAALVPLNLRLTATETARLVEHCEPRVFLVDDAGRVPHVHVPTLDALYDLDSVPVARHQQLPDRLELSEPLTIVYTSGTTGAPKGVVLTNANHAGAALASRERLGHGGEDSWLATLPLYHVGGLAILTRSVLEGSRVLLEDGFDASRVAQAIRDGSATMVSLVPTMLARVLDALEGPPSARLRCVLVGGAALPAALATRAVAAGLPIAPTYGLTEACSQVCTSTPSGDVVLSGVVGPSLPGVEIRIDAPDEDGIGEVLVRGNNVMMEYFRNEAATADVLQEHWLRTGDLGSLDVGGRLRLACRRYDLIVTGGENVAPPEVEAVLAEHPGVAECAVFGVEDPEWGQRVVALVVAHEKAPAPARLGTWCRERLAAYKTPREFRFVEALARNATGKVDRTALGSAWSEAGSVA